MNGPVFSWQRQRIALATDSLAPAGVGEHMLALANGIRHAFEVVLAFPNCGNGPAFLRRASESGFATQALSSTDPDESYVEWLREASLSLLHIHAGTAWEGHALLRAARTVGLPVVRTEHLPFVLTDAVERRDHIEALAQVDRLLVVSDASAKTYREAGLPEGRIKTVRNGVPCPIARQPRVETRASLGVVPDELMLLTVARFTAQKGHAVLVDALVEVFEDYPQARLFLAGDGPLCEAIRRSVEAFGFSERVTFLGERDDVGDLLAAADLFILPSLFEGLPLVILEAMASRLPVVATRVGGTVEALGDAYPWLAEPASPAALAKCIAAALSDPQARAAHGEALLERYRRNFRVERMAEETTAVYRSLIPALAA